MLVGENAGATPFLTRRQCGESVSAENSVRCPVNDISRSDRSGSSPLFSACACMVRGEAVRVPKEHKVSASRAGNSC